MDNFPQPQPTPQRTRPLFYDICLMYEFDDNALQAIANMAGVDKSIVDAMFVSLAVRHVDAEKVLVAFSEYTGQTWGLDNVKVTLLPTFADLLALHQFDLVRLATSAGVPYATLDMMRSGDLVT
jgi:hypothetical protein